MMDLALIQGAIGSLQAAGTIAKGLLNLKSLADVQGKVIELQSAILAAQRSALSAQAEQSAMIQQVANLEKEVARMKAWEETKQRYQLISAWDGGFVYALKQPLGEATEPPHWICAKCYEDGRKSVLQSSYNFGAVGDTEYICPACSAILVPHGGRRPIPLDYSR